MINRNPQLAALALLVYKFGERIPGGGFEVKVSAADLVAIVREGRQRG